MYNVDAYKHITKLEHIRKKQTRTFPVEYPIASSMIRISLLIRLRIRPMGTLLKNLRMLVYSKALNIRLWSVRPILMPEEMRMYARRPEKKVAEIDSPR
jgi:hypothetical protein